MSKTSKKILIISLLSFVAFFVYGCANTQNKGNKSYTPYAEYISNNNLKSVNSINTFKFMGWAELDNKHLIVDSNHKKSYLLKLSSYCNDLDITHNIALNQSFSTKLNSKFDSIIVPNNPHFKCTIDEIYPITKEQKQEILDLGKVMKQSDEK